MSITISLPTGGLEEIRRRVPQGVDASEFVRCCALGQSLPSARHSPIEVERRRAIFAAAMARNCMPDLCNYVSDLGSKNRCEAVVMAALLMEIDFILARHFPQINPARPRFENSGQINLKL